MKASKRSRNATKAQDALQGQVDDNDSDVCPPLLYKYMGMQFGIQVFTKLRIKYTEPKELNDPFECRPVALQHHEGSTVPVPACSAEILIKIYLELGRYRCA